MTDVETFALDGHDVQVPRLAGWEAAIRNGRLRLRRGAAAKVPLVSVDVAIVAGPDAAATLDEELSGCIKALTDFTVLHVEPRPARSGNWPAGEPPALPFVLAGFRQGVFSLLLELGVVGGDGTRSALAISTCMAEEAAAAQPELDEILEGIEITWR